jgi:hypothetical protein
VNAAAASFGGSGPPPSYGGNSFVLGPLGDSGAGQRTTDPRARYDRAIQQGANALFGMLRTPGGDAPDGPFGVALANSARAVAAARADIEAEGSLFGTGYGTLTPGNPATRAAAARLAAELGVGPAGSGGSAEPRTPWWRFGMAENPYLLAARSRPPTSGTMAAYMQALDAASRAAARSRGRNTLIGGPGGDVPASTDSSSIWAHTGRAKGPFEAPLARARNPDEIGGKRLEVLYGDPLFKEYLHRLAIREGAESDDATDRGGATKLGMSQKFLTALRDRDPNDVPG